MTELADLLAEHHNPPTDPEPARGDRRERERMDKRMPVGLALTDGEGWLTIETDEQVPIGSGAETGAWDWMLDHHPAVTRDTHEIDDRYPVEIGSWQIGFTVGTGDNRTADAKDLFRYKAKVRLRRPGIRLTDEKVAELIRSVRRRKPPKLPEHDPNGEWLVLCLSDLQLGKSDFGGTESALDRVARTLDRVVAMIRERPVDGVVIIDMGDITEGTACFYDNQSFSIELNLTQQIDVGTEVMFLAMERLLALVPQMILGFVPSNHGSARHAVAA